MKRRQGIHHLVVLVDKNFYIRSTAQRGICVEECLYTLHVTFVSSNEQQRTTSRNAKLRSTIDQNSNTPVQARVDKKFMRTYFDTPLTVEQQLESNSGRLTLHVFSALRSILVWFPSHSLR